MKTDEYRVHILEYFRKNLNKGYDTETLKWALIKQGYSRSIVDWAVTQIHKELAEKAPLLKEKPKITYESLEENMPAQKPKKPWWKRLFGG